MALKKFTQLSEREFNLVFQTWEDCYEYLLGIQKVSLISKSEKCPECGQIFTRETLNKRKTCTGKYVLSHKLERGTGDCCGKNILSPKLYFFTNVKKEITSKDRDEKSGKPIKKIVEKTIYPFNTRYDSQLLGVFKIIWGILTGNLPQYETPKGIEVEMKRFWIIKEDSDIITPKEFFVKVQEIIQYKNALNNTEFMGVVRSNIISPEIPVVTASTVATTTNTNPEAEYEPPKGLSEQALKIHKMVYEACSKETDITRIDAIRFAGYMALIGLKKVSSFEENIFEKVLKEMPGFSSTVEIDNLSSTCYTSFTMFDSDSIVDKLIPQPQKVVENKVILSIELDEIFNKSPKRDFGKKEFFWTISDFKAVVQEQLGFDPSEDQIERYFESKSK